MAWALFDRRPPAGYTEWARGALFAHVVPVAQLAERQIVALEVVGSNPIGYPHWRILHHDASNADTVGVRGIIV